MSCEELEELLAAHALSALSELESNPVRAHLASCQKHDAALADLQLVAGRLPLAADEREPPATLRGRLLRAFDEQVAPHQRPASSSRPLPLWWRRPALAWAAAAALLVAVVGLVSWNVALQLGGASSDMVRADLRGTAGSGALVYLKDERLAVLTLELPALPASRAYQAWGISNSGPVSLGLVNSGTTALSADLSGADTVAITEEPAGGSTQPTSDPLLSAPFAD